MAHEPFVVEGMRADVDRTGGKMALMTEEEEPAIVSSRLKDEVLEQKRLQRQKELLKKKKAERRAHAKQRKKQIEPQVDDESALGKVPPETAEMRQRDDVSEEYQKSAAEMAGSEHFPEQSSTTDGGVSIERAQLGREEATTTNQTSRVDESGSGITPNVAAALHEEKFQVQLPNTEAYKGNIDSVDPFAVVGVDHQELPTSYSIQDEAMIDIQRESTLSTPSQFFGQEADSIPIEIRPKKVKKRKPARDPDAAAVTIQTAFKHTLLRKTRKTLKKAKSLIRHSSKVLAEELFVQDPVEEVVVAEPVPHQLPFIPPLALGQLQRSSFRSEPLVDHPIAPPDNGDDDDDDGDEETAPSGASSEDDASTRAMSDISSPSSSSSESDSSKRRRQRQKRLVSKTRKRNEPQSSSSEYEDDSDDPAMVPVSGPSAGLLPSTYTGSQTQSQKQLKTRPRYGDVHHYMATRIQAQVRGRRGRSIAMQRLRDYEREIREEAMRELKEEASVRIQARMKGYLLRKRLNVEIQTSRTESTALHQTTKTKKRVATRLKSNSVLPHRDVSSTTLFANADSPIPTGDDEVPIWPTEFNLEPTEGWEELNSVATTNGDLTTHVEFLSKGQLRVFCGTWNLHAKKPEDDLRLWIALNRYHIIAVGTEECVHSIAKSVVFTSKKQWETQLKETLGEEYVLVASHSLTAIHNVVFVHESVLPLLHSIQSDAVATGIGNQLGNKGGIGIAFSVGHTSFAFINSHFDAHQHNVAKRNANFHRINQELKLYPVKTIGTPAGTPEGLGKTTSSRFSTSAVSSPNDLTRGSSTTSLKVAVSSTFDRVFWYGDLNYRINGTRRMIDRLLLLNQHAVLRFNDQLQLEMAKGHVFPHFREGPLHFRPTYKFDKRSNVYDSSTKQRIPSWTDRILYLTNEKPHDIEILSYRSEMSFQSSDHRPVGAVFRVAFTPPPSTQHTDHAFARILARGYQSTQLKSEVCVLS
ncbi:hypothetical protein Poli38472_011756 [Pythium oligandrum]|uniref:Inositol polyphosphate-related phosphatase domain-containing protein n=1 Tax=Pythium oligandrum TaxID=41045 RepID=A0A8K1FGW6_PYTOL|nr:hypothetical protein Poli38472_011756 [Pythium oligandrum]|eukprot:TMW58168.1 hypothetical protein Poli38472_011756 [Pythium oligandrum]